ncbi:MAG: 4-(cytidine 5'-diphospho)-2-C-methyl-D-erythritol kinase [Prevotellaceae bacterium]|nr:4-(cytidine 5'-diphospho)-2-C-methyl-D-erythritol kinase [Prevotellaceae bacterium]
MLTFPNAKINLGLNIVARREDGYHDLETVFYPIPVEDALEVVIKKDKVEGAKYSLHLYGTAIAGKVEENLVVKAYRLLDSLYGLPPVDIHLVKRVPTGAGLGGGSSDAAAMLKLLNSVCGLGMDDATLEKHAARLGADCAFFIKNKPVYAEGIGNVFSPIELSLKGYRLCLVKPDVSVSTKEAYAAIRPHRQERPLREVVKLPVAQWRGLMVNDFEESVFPRFPLLREIKEELYRRGAVYAAMSGSGSAIYGLFEKETSLPKWDFGKDVFTAVKTLD